VATYYLFKVFFTVVIVMVIGLCLRQLYQLWFLERISLAPFVYQRNGAVDEGQGNSFTQQVYQNLRGLQSLLEGEDPLHAASAASASQAADLPARVTALQPPNPPPSIGLHLRIPEIEKAPLSGVEIKVQGVDIASLARGLLSWIDPPDELVGSVVESGANFSALVERRRARVSSSAEPTRYFANDYATVSDAALATASNVLYLLVVDQDESFKKKIGQTDFLIFTRALRNYALFREIVVEMRSTKDVTDKAQPALSEADRLVAGLLDRGVGETFQPIYILAAITAIAKNDSRQARECLRHYLKANPKDASANDLLNSLPPDPDAVAVKGVDGGASATTSKQKHRPVQPGTSAGSSGMSAGDGLICCIVQDKTDAKKRYLLSSNHVFRGNPGTSIVQPSPRDGGSAPLDQVAHVFKSIEDKPTEINRLAGTLGDVMEGIPVNPKCFAIGAFAGTAKAKSGDRVMLVGRTSDVSKGVVMATDVSETIHVEGDPTPRRFAGLVACKGEGGKPFARPGDSGAPVVNVTGQLVGMLYAGSNNVCYFIPIEPLLDALDVTLVKE
jgi:S1-C subfamily serine protease